MKKFLIRLSFCIAWACLTFTICTMVPESQDTSIAYPLGMISILIDTYLIKHLKE